MTLKLHFGNQEDTPLLGGFVRASGEACSLGCGQLIQVHLLKVVNGILER